MSHLTESVLLSLAAGSLCPEPWLRAVRHLLSGCALCQARMETFAPLLLSDAPGEEGASGARSVEADEAYESALDRAFARARKFEGRWRKEKGLLAQVLPLLRAAPERGLHAVSARQRDRVFGWPLAEALLQMSFEERYRNPDRMVSLAAAACRVACATEEEDYPAGLVCNLRARASAELANAYRVQEDYREAEKALLAAYQNFEEGTQDRGLLARLCVVEASLRRAQRRTSEALALLSQAEDLYRQLGERHLAGRTLVNQGVTWLTAKDPRKAVQCFEQGIALLDRARDPKLLTTACQSLLAGLVQCREYRRAGELLLESGLRQAFANEPLNLLRLRWLEGQIQAGLGRLAHAERAFMEVRAGFREHDLEYDAALAGLDLAAVWVRQGKLRKVQRLASEMVETFQWMEVSVEASKAMTLLRISCEEKVVSLQLVEGVRGFLERLQAEPHLTMEEGLRI